MKRAVSLAIALVVLMSMLGVKGAYSQSTSTSLSVTTTEATAVTASSAELHGTLNPGASSGAGWFEWGTTSALGSRTDVQTFAEGTSGITFAASIRNLQPHTIYYFRAVGYRTATGGVVNGDTRTFTTTGDAVTTTSVVATTTEATSLTSSSATLNGTINPGGGSVSAWFDWGTSTSLGTRTDVQTIASGTTAVALTVSLRNLQAHTVYYFRASAYRPAGGGAAVGDIRTFTTSDAPVTSAITVTTGEAREITSSSAALSGTINATGSALGAWFEWGTTTALGTRTDTQMFNDGGANLTVTASLRNLQPHTTYYFRAAGYRSANIVSGDIRSFTTASETAGTLSILSVEATAVTSTATVLKATVNTGGSTATGYFEWGTSSALSTRSDVRTLASGTAVTLTQELGRLLPHTTYYFRAVVTVSNTATPVRSDIRSFTTASDTPAALTMTTNDASAVSSSSAELRGMINPGGTAATAWFEWGSTRELGNQTTAQSVASATTTSNYSYSLSNLQPYTAYYYRAAGQNSAGTVRGDVKTFTTTRVPSTTPQTTEVETGAIRSGYVIITPDPSSDAPSVTMTYGTVSQGAVQSQAGIIPTLMTTDASMFVEVIPSISRNIGVAIVNPGGSASAVTLTLRDENGFVLGSPATVSIPAHQQVAKFLSELFGTELIANGFRGSLRLQSAAPFAAVGLRFSGTVFSTLPVAATAVVPGVPSITLTAGATANSPAAGTVGGSTALIIPQFAISGGWATQIVLVNNTNATLVGRVDIFDTSGNPMAVNLNGETRSTFTYSIPVGGTFVLAPRDSNGQSPL